VKRAIIVVMAASVLGEERGVLRAAAGRQSNAPTLKDTSAPKNRGAGPSDDVSAQRSPCRAEHYAFPQATSR